ncbi:MAG: hypothetical protein P9M08_00760 [Candidatus Erginobacter occultus]|nr:hypothetical protein [Candidatus Erginobacter occultus]
MSAAPKIDLLSICTAGVWGLAGIFVALSAPSPTAVLLFLPAGFPLSAALLAGVHKFIPGLTGTTLLFAFPFQNLLTGYFAAKLLRRYWKSAGFRRTFIGAAGVLILLYLLFITPLITALSDDGCLSPQQAFGELNRIRIDSVPAELNAATYYRSANKMMSESGFENIFGTADFPPAAPWKAENHPEIARWFDDHPEVMRVIEQGTRQEFCRGYIGWETDGSYYPPVENFDPKLLQAVLADLSLSLGENGPGRSLPALNRAVRVAGHFYQRESLLSSIVANVSESAGLQPLLRDVLLSGPLSGQFCETLIDRMAWLDLLAEKAIRYRLLYELRLSELWIYSASSYSLFIRPAFPGSNWEASAMVEMIRLRWRTLFLPRGETLARYRLWLELLEKVAFTPPYSPEYDDLKKDLENIETMLREDPLLGYSIPRYYDLVDVDLRGSAERRLTILLAALKLYRAANGIYPETIGQIVPDHLPFLPRDPYSDQPWIYRREDGRITIASNQGEGTEISVSFPGE